MQKILIIEDDPAIRDELCLILCSEGFDALAVTAFDAVAEQVHTACPDLVLLDLGLPGRDGFLLCAEIRKQSAVPVIFVTSRDGAMDELRALNLGGDDYITKPYEVPVLLAHIRAVLRRRGAPAECDVLEAGGARLSLVRGAVSHGANTAELSRNELRILACLMVRQGAIVSRADLLDTLWDNRIYLDDNTLSVNMTRLRAKLTELGLPDLIKTRRGLGYQI